MSTTSLTLLQKLVTPADAAEHRAAWHRFAALYTPLLLAWARAQRLQDADAADFAQDVLVRLLRVLPAYRREDGHRFRGWLFTVVRNLYTDFHRSRRTRPHPGADGLSGLADTTPPDAVADMDEREYRLRLIRRAAELVRADFAPAVWQAFHAQAVEGRPAAAVAADLGITVNAATSAKTRVLARIREELAGFLT